MKHIEFCIKEPMVSDDMDFDAACQFRDKCLGMGYDIIYVIQIMG